MTDTAPGTEHPAASTEESTAPVTAVLPEDRGQFTARIRQELEGISQVGALSEEKAYEAWQRVNTLHENLVQAFTRSSDSEHYTTEEGDLFSDMAKIRVRLHSQMGSYAFIGM